MVWTEQEAVGEVEFPTTRNFGLRRPQEGRQRDRLRCLKIGEGSSPGLQRLLIISYSLFPTFFIEFSDLLDNSLLLLDQAGSLSKLVHTLSTNELRREAHNKWKIGNRRTNIEFGFFVQK